MNKNVFLRGLNDFLARLQEIGLMVYSVYQDKGIKYFRDPLLVGAAATLLIYIAVYKPLGQARLHKLGEVESLKAQAAYSSEYQSYRAQITGNERKLPPFGDKSEWLTGKIREACAAEDVVPESMNPPSEGEMGDYVKSDVQFTARLTYRKLASLLARLESSPLIMRVTELGLSKDEAALAKVRVSVHVSTIFAKPVPAQPAAGAGGNNQ